MVEATVQRDNPELLAVILIAVAVGLRRNEILRLEWESIDFDNSVIRVVASHTKTERERLAPFTRRAADALRNLPGYERRTGKVFTGKYIQRSWSTSKRIAGLVGLQFRDLRRTAGTRMELLGIPAYDRSKDTRTRGRRYYGATLYRGGARHGANGCGQARRPKRREVA